MQHQSRQMEVVVFYWAGTCLITITLLLQRVIKIDPYNIIFKKEKQELRSDLCIRIWEIIKTNSQQKEDVNDIMYIEMPI